MVVDEKAINTLGHKKVRSQASRNLLIIGGTSSLSEYICQLALIEGMTVHCTYRNSSKIFLKEKINWIYLEYEDEKSIIEALLALQEIEIDQMIYLAGELSGLQNKRTEIDEINKYFKRNISTPTWLLHSLVNSNNFKSNSTISYLSSRASDFGSNDHCYGITKAALENLIKSFSLLGDVGIKFKIIVSGLIQGSRMQKDMPLHVAENHKVRAGDTLLNVQDCADQIWKISCNSESPLILERIKIGPDYL